MLYTPISPVLLVGEQMTKDYPDGAKIAVLDFPSNESCVDRVNGFLEGLGDQKDKFEIVAQQDGGAALDQSMGLAEDIITANPDLEAFFCINDPSALGALVPTNCVTNCSISSSMTAVSTLKIGMPASAISASPEVIPAESTGITNTAS